jgi:hypothetical protein
MQSAHLKRTKLRNGKNQSINEQWTTLDNFLPTGVAIPYSVVSDAVGHLLVAGYADWGDGTGSHWIVRQY